MGYDPPVERSPLGPGPLVYAHRGDRMRAADNTLDAFRLAVDAGAHGIELDVRRTADGVLVLTHDPVIGGLDLAPVADLSFAEVRDAAPAVPSLAEGLAHIPPHVFVNVEVKNAPHEPGFDESRSIVDETVALIVSDDDPRRILLSSFDPLAIEPSGSRRSVHRGLLVTQGVDIDTAVSLTGELYAHALHPPFGTIADDPAGSVAACRRAGLAVVVWDANSAPEIETAVAAGCDVVITDDPATGRSIVG